ncbi:RNA polymerase sigma factor [Legionella cardiaca]|uniref:Sigma-70 family RNA polymerase sigma factor n=1 Tax=Legionella cardiaca TaxID=1071983 RepID=A0ABY8AUM5_9GAMM|nr:sigma-70 family RNA polymerase sigma factor [Legionella cardiaca]WED44400.1 sigma-70 family RNA polymerase sigma factor [Legionella cardiaca]
MDCRKLTDCHLIDLALAGDSLAVNHLILRHRTKIFLQIHSQIDDFSLVNDLAQEVCLKVFRYLPSFKQQSSFTTWLYRITQNTVLNHFRALKAQMSEDIYLARIENTNHSPESYAVGMQLREKINQVLLSMPKELKHCFHLHVIKGLSYKAIAKRLHVPIGTVRSRIHRARCLLREQIDFI